jgi:two-component sensor histidine kinase
VRMFYADDAHADFDKLNASVRGGTTVYADVMRRHKDGHLIDVSISVAPMYDEAGRLVGISAIIADIGERKARERHIEFLMRELAHRSKNLLAVVQAIAGQTARHSSSLQGFQARFSQRVHALARSQDLLVARDWKGANLAELVRSQLAPFADETATRIDMRGPEIEIRADLVHSITLAVHELATNAAKYGALSVPEGHVAISWELNGMHAENRHFRISWHESNGPTVSPPAKKGFGHVVISDMVASSLRGEVTLEYAREGLRWTLDMPGGNVTARTDA